MVNKRFLNTLFIFTLLTLAVIAFVLSKEDKSPILLGASLPTSGITKELGQDVVAGANAWFYHINAQGGIHDREVRLVYYDDKYEPQHTMRNLETLIHKDRVFAFFGFVGTPTVKKILPRIMDEDIPFFAPYTGASFLRDTGDPHVINFRAGYKEEIEHVIDYLHVQKGMTRFAVFYQNDDYGEEGYIATVNALKKYNLKLSGEGTYKRNTLSIRHALQEIKTTKPEAIILVGAYKPSALFIQQARECCMKEVTFCPISFVNSDALVSELGGKTQHILFSQTVPSYEAHSSEVAQEFQTLLKKFYPKQAPTFVAFESFLAAKALTTAMKETKAPLTRQKLLDTLSHQKKTDLGGVIIESNTQHMLNSVYLSIYDKGAFHTIDIRQF